MAGTEGQRGMWGKKLTINKDKDVELSVIRLVIVSMKCEQWRSVMKDSASHIRQLDRLVYV